MKKIICYQSVICFCLSAVVNGAVLASETLGEYECLHLSIGLHALIETQNRYYQRDKKPEYDPNSAIPKGLLMLKRGGESCDIKQQLYLEAVEYSLHFGKLDDAAYFLEQARQENKK